MPYQTRPHAIAYHTAVYCMEPCHLHDRRGHPSSTPSMVYSVARTEWYKGFRMAVRTVVFTSTLHVREAAQQDLGYRNAGSAVQQR